MSKSIETIWKEGFTDNHALAAPKINDIYNRKSIHIVDKVKRMYKINLIAIVVGTLIGLAFFIFVGFPYLGLYITLLLGYIVHEGRKQYDLVSKIDKGVDCYHYLKSVNNWFKSLHSHFIRIYRYFYPLLFAGIAAQFLVSDTNAVLTKTILDAYPNTFLLFGVPLWTMLGILIITAILFLFGGAIGKFDIELLYGNIMKRMDSIIEDMEALR